VVTGHGCLRPTRRHRLAGFVLGVAGAYGSALAMHLVLIHDAAGSRSAERLGGAYICMALRLIERCKCSCQVVLPRSVGGMGAAGE